MMAQPMKNGTGKASTRGRLWLPLLLCVCVAGLLPGRSLAAGDGLVAVEFVPALETSAQYIYVSDVARFVEGDRDYWLAAGAERISYGPRPGSEFTLTVETILGRLAERGYDWRRFQVSGAAEVLISAGGQTAGSGELVRMIEARTTEALGVPVAFAAERNLPEPLLPEGALTVDLSFPDRPGTWLPETLHLSVDGEQVQTVPLCQYGEFVLNVIVAPAGIAPRTRVSPAYLGLVEQSLRPGTEVVVLMDQISGLVTKSRISAGGRVLHSKLRVPYDINRGDEVVLVINAGGIEMRARAAALNNAYLGQRLLVERVDDGQRFTGVVEQGPVVVVE